MDKFIVLPDCTDLNRGDQALVWETVRLAKDAGFSGTYYIQSESNLSQQSIEQGLKCFSPILKHPSRTQNTNNISYGKAIKIRWGTVALFDLVTSLFVLLISRYEFLWFFLRQRTRNTLNLYKSANAAFVKGGGFLQSYGGITTFYFIYYHLYPIYLANRMNVPVYIMPNSFGPLDGFSAKWQVRLALQKAKHISCRETISYNYMKTYFPEINFNLADDLGFYLEPNNNTKFPLDYDGRMVAITARPYRFPEHTEDNSAYYSSYVKSLSDLAEYIYNKGYMPVFVQHTLALNDHEDDKKCIDDICRQLPNGHYFIIANRDFNCKELKQVYSNFMMIIGTRFHSVIFSIASLVPAIAIAYGGNKSQGIMRDNNLEKYVVDIDKVSGDVLCKMFDDVCDNYPLYKTELENLYTSILKRRRKYVEELKQSREQ